MERCTSVEAASAGQAPSCDLPGAYRGRAVLLTGATGFLGKAVLERLLWDLPELREVRVLLRPGSHAPACARFQELLASPIFARLESRFGGRDAFQALALSKVRIFEGDLARDRFGLGDCIYRDLAHGLDLIMHSAALVSWDERLDRSIESNTLGARRVLALAEAAGGAGVVHISSAFVHGQRRGFCPEEIPARLDVDAEVQAAQAYAREAEAESRQPEALRDFAREARLRAAVPEAAQQEAEKLRAAWVHRRVAAWGVQRARSNGWWDNYTYSKALAEMILAAERRDAHVAIVRPSGITGAINEPQPGWTDAYLLTEPLIEGVGKKSITEFPGSPDCVIDTVPVDLVVNVILAVGCRLLQQPCAEGPPVVYQVATGDTNPLTLGEIERIWRGHFAERPFRRQQTGDPITGIRPVAFWDSAEDFAASLRRRYVWPLRTVQRAVELLPGWASVPALRQARGAAVRQWRTVEKVLRLAKLYSSYTLNEWRFQTGNTRALMEGLSPRDQERFPFQPQRIDWPHFWAQVHIPGMRRHVLGESDVALAPPARARL